MNPTDILVESIYNLMNAEIPEDVILEAKKCILDFLGTAFAGAEMLKPKNLAYLEHFPNGHGTSTVIGLQKKASMHNAAFINGMNSHITELDDGQRYCYVHLGSTILPALLAVAEHENLGAGGLLRGIIMGYESAIRLGRAIQPSHKNRGYHVSGTCGTIGAATAVAAALNFSKEQMKDAISAAAASAAGMLEVLEDQSELKPFNIGRASLDGLTAAYVARAGFHGPDDILGGKRGFFALMSDQYDISGLSDEAGCEYNIKFIYRKPYAACRHCHPPIEAAINIRNRQGIRGKDVKSINVYTYKQAVFGHDHTTIQGMTSAKMSIPYCVAAALETGRADIFSYMPEFIEDLQIGILTQKVNVYEDNNLSKLVPHKRSAIVEVLTHTGRSFTERIDYPKGEPENPLSIKDIEDKFISLAVYGGKTEKEAIEIIEHVWDIEACLGGLFKLLY